MHNAAEGFDVSFSDVADNYVRNLAELNRRPTTISSARYKYNRIARTFGEQYINSITKAELETWLKDQHLSPASRNNFLRYIKALFNFAVDNGFTGHWFLRRPASNRDSGFGLG
jgi:site-specific recombinase XerD